MERLLRGESIERPIAEQVALREARVRVAVVEAKFCRARRDASCARSTLASSSTSTWPARTFAPDSNRMARTTPGISLLIVTPRPAATLP